MTGRQGAICYQDIQKLYLLPAQPTRGSTGAQFASGCQVRPKLHAPGEPARDFVVQGAAEHGVRGLVNLFGIESPGLTACLALAELVVRRLDGDSTFRESTC